MKKVLFTFIGFIVFIGISGISIAYTAIPTNKSIKD